MKLGFVIHWNGPPARCVGAEHTRCINFWSAVKHYHVSTKGWSDIAYSFGVCPHGIRFTGRGWNRNQFANGEDQVGPDDGKDSEWYTVLTFLGEGEEPTPEMVDGVKALIQDGRDEGKCGDRVLPHNAFKRKTCPGPHFTALAKLWDRNADLLPSHQPVEPTPPDPPEIDMTSPTIVFDGPTRHVFCQGTDRALWHKQDAGTWKKVGGVLAEGSSPAAAVSDQGVVNVAVTGDDGQIFLFRLLGGKWGGPFGLGGRAA